MPAVISNTLLVLCEDFDATLDAGRVVRALARGIEADGRLACDRCPLQQAFEDTSAHAPAARLGELDFDARMLAAHALVIAVACLEDRTLAGSVAFEAATRARQSGVPAYAVTARDRLDRFEARIVDLQVVLEAGSTRALAAAGRKLATLV
ncbi:MAG TPA: hypothetical protein VFR48_10325 [Solirubrobacteraceae bacterium]|nr:hypothetical protein [Solirubrobacteraceae bacterium]